MINDNLETVISLFLLNTEAHILTTNFDRKWAREKILDLVQYIEEGKANAAGYFDQDKLVGFIWIFPYLYKNQERYYLNAIAVFPEYRHRQIAKTLFHTMENFVRLKEKTLYTHADVANTKVCRFYFDCGMVEEYYQLVKVINRKI